MSGYKLADVLYAMTEFSRTLPFLLLLAVWGLVSCADSTAVMPTAPQTTPLALAPALQPTPTLAPGAATPALPTPPVTPRPETAVDPTNSATAQTGANRVSPTATAVLTPIEHMEHGDQAMHYGDYATAAGHFLAVLRVEDELSGAAQTEALYKLGVAYLREGRYTDAGTVFNQLIQLAGEDAPIETYFQLGQALAVQGSAQAAVDAYQTYAEAKPEMAAYVYPLIAEQYVALGDGDAAGAAYEAAVEGPSQRFKVLANRQALAEYYLLEGDYDAAIAQYDAIHDVAQTENTRGQMTYLAGTAEIQSGDTQAGYERYLFGVDNYPRAYETYLGLVELVKAEIPVDDYQRGLVDYYAAAYAPGIEAFERYLATSPEPEKPDAHLFLAWSYEALGEVDAALEALKAYAEAEPERAALERAKLLARAGRTLEAIDAYLSFLELYPESEDAPEAAWGAAALTEQQGDVETAVTRYIALVDAYPDASDAPEALFHAGWLLRGLDDNEQADDLWERAAREYPASEFGAAAMVWLLRDGRINGLPDTFAQLTNENPADHYYALRASDLANGIAPFEPTTPFLLPDGENEEELRRETAVWLQERLQLEPISGSPAALPEAIRDDPRHAMGETLWQLGLLEPAKWELEDLRSDYADDALASYQLALYFRDLGLYRSSIIAAATALSLSEANVFEAPRYLGQLAYPTYYADKITALADEYGYDPRLQFALVRQESLFESFARSGAAAQGLSQVIPDTGLWIAQRLEWPGYVNDDLYKPHVGLTFGAYYLDQQLQAFDGSVHAALAAYNAGPGNAARWYETAGSDHDFYVETVDFFETRTYIERIYAGFALYRYLYALDAP